MWLLKLLRKIRKIFTPYNPSVLVTISRTRLLDNLHEYQEKYPKFLFAPVLKSNAYGHGLVQVAQVLARERLAFFVLDSIFEAITLRNNGLKTKILLIGYTQLENILNSRLSNVSFTITSLEQLRALASKALKKALIHIKIDTGMHRQGILPEQVNEAIELLKTNKLLVLEGVCSHFADADNIDQTFTRSQLVAWEKIVSIFKKEFPDIKFFHISATAGVFYGEQTAGNVARLGIGLYGINSSPLVKFALKPVLQMESIISSIKNLPAGEFVGYNATSALKQSATIATVPAGYFEGVDRGLSNCGFFKITDDYCPIIGRVSMNITSIDVTHVHNLKLGDKVTIISDKADDKNSVENIAKLTQTIPWEILVHLPQHLRRIVV